MKSWEKHPQFLIAREIYQKLQNEGFEVYFAGGCVRDGLLGRTPKDFDLASNAAPEQVQKLFSKTIDVGKKFGVIVVVEKNISIEVTTFRSEELYQDGRHPEKIVFTDAKEDAKRRDFTINAMFYDLNKKQVIDYVDGKKDLEKKIIRAVGVASERFQEDYLRMLRAVRFVSELGFSLDNDTQIAIRQNADLLKKVSAERITAEMSKLLLGDYSFDAIKKLLELHLWTDLIDLKLWQLFKSDITSETLAWSLFWICVLKASVDLSYQEIVKKILLLKFSNETKKNLQKCLKVFFKKEIKLVDLIIGLYNPGEALAYEILAHENTEYKSVYERAVQRKQELGTALPKPFIQAKDLEKKFTGPKLGSKLEELYHLQLIGEIHSRAEALKRV